MIDSVAGAIAQPLSSGSRNDMRNLGLDARVHVDFTTDVLSAEMLRIDAQIVGMY